MGNYSVCPACGYEWIERLKERVRCPNNRCRKTLTGRARGRPKGSGKVAVSGTPQKAIVRQERVIPEMSPKVERPRREPKETAEGVKELAYERDEY